MCYESCLIAIQSFNLGDLYKQVIWSLFRGGLFGGENQSEASDLLPFNSIPPFHHSRCPCYKLIHGKGINDIMTVKVVVMQHLQCHSIALSHFSILCAIVPMS